MAAKSHRANRHKTSLRPRAVVVVMVVVMVVMVVMGLKCALDGGRVGSEMGTAEYGVAAAPATPGLDLPSA